MPQTLRHDFQRTATCPICGVAPESMTHSPGYVMPVERFGPGGVPTVDYVQWTPQNQARYDTGIGFATPPQRDPQYDHATLEPCGHAFYGDAATRVVRAFNAEKARYLTQVADQTIAEHAGLLASARALLGAGPSLADAYESAVRSGSRDEHGLLSALKILAED